MNPLEVLPYDGVFRCLVRSAKNPKRTYLVDLDSYSGIGWCGCRDFETRRGPKIKLLNAQQRRNAGDELRCKHLVMARRVRGEQLLDEIIKQRAEKARKL